MASPRPPSPAASDAAANGDDGVAEAAPEEFWLFGYGYVLLHAFFLDWSWTWGEEERLADQPVAQ